MDIIVVSDGYDATVPNAVVERDAQRIAAVIESFSTQ